MQSSIDNITIFLFATTFLIMGMGVFVITIAFVHRKKQIAYQENIKDIEANYEKNLLKTQLEIREQTFQNISREIHDNISLSLTLAKLHLNTLDWNNVPGSIEKVTDSIGLLTISIAELSDISKSMNAEIIIQHGLLQAIEDELQHIRKTGLFGLEFTLLGTPIYLSTENELIVFRIIQEAFNNIIKHSDAKVAQLIMQYYDHCLEIIINDDGKGFDMEARNNNRNAGVKNMETRIKVLKGVMRIKSQPGKGTILSFIIPFN